MLSRPEVSEFLGGSIISAKERTDTGGTLLYGCEVIASNGTSLLVHVKSASNWDEWITTFGNEPYEGPEDSSYHYSDIVGLSWQFADGNYASVRLPNQTREVHLAALSLIRTLI